MALRKARLWCVVTLIIAVLTTQVFAQEGPEGPPRGANTIRIVTYGTHENLHEVAKRFMESHPEYRVEVQTYSFEEYPQKIPVMIASNSAPDIFQTWAQYKVPWIEAGLIRDMTPFWSRFADLSDVLFPFVMETVLHDGKYWGVPHDFNSEVWILVKDRFDAAGIPIPYDDWTVEEFREYARLLTDPQGRWLGAANPVAFGWGSSWQWARNWTGQGWLSDDRTEVLVDKPEYVEMLTFFLEMVTQDESMNGGSLAAPQDAWSGGYSMWQGWVDFSFQLAANETYEFRFATMPRGRHGQKAFAQGHMWSVPVNAPNPEGAFVFLEWLISREGQEAMVAIGKRQPLSPDPELWDLYFSQLPDSVRDHVRTFVLDVLYGRENVDIMRYWITWPEVNDIMARYLSDVFYLRESPANAMTQAAQEIRSYLVSGGTTQ